MTCRERMSNGGVVPKVVAQTTNRIRASRSSSRNNLPYPQQVNNEVSSKPTGQHLQEKGL